MQDEKSGSISEIYRVSGARRSKYIERDGINEIVIE